MQKIEIEITDATYDPHFRCKRPKKKDDKLQEYYRGLKNGLCGVPPDGDAIRYETYDYIRGISDGTQIFRALVDNYRKEIKHPLTTEVGD